MPGNKVELFILALNVEKLASFLSILIAATPALAEISLPAGTTGLVEIPSISPIPQYCRPTGNDANLFVASKTNLLPVFEADGIEDFNEVVDFGFFDLSGLFLFDNNDTGKPEAYGFGTARSGAGGGFPPYLWVNNRGEQIDFREGSYSENFSKGMLLDERYLGDGLPTLVIDLSEWTCSVSTYSNGDVAAN